jgi:hypothetical protein
MRVEHKKTCGRMEQSVKDASEFAIKIKAGCIGL